MRSNVEIFSNKKFVLILTDQIASRTLAYAGALIGFQFGRKVPEMVGRDQMVPMEKAESDGTPKKRTHLGITTQNLPVLNGLGYESMRAIRDSLREEKSLLVTEVTDAAATCATYDDYAKAIATTPAADTNYWGIGIFGDAAIINKYTQGLKLYGNQPKIPNSDSTLPERRLIGGAADLPTIRLILANNLPGGVLANTAAILGVTYAKLFGDSLFGPDLMDRSGQMNLGLPMIDLAILNGHSDTNLAIRTLRENLHAELPLSVVDVTDATGKTRCYEDYLTLAENTPVLETAYWGVGVCGSADLVLEQTADFGLYITSAEEQALLKKQKAAEKLEARKAAVGGKEGGAVGKSGASAFKEAAVKGGLGWQKKLSAVVGQVDAVSLDDDQKTLASACGQSSLPS